MERKHTPGKWESVRMNYRSSEFYVGAAPPSRGGPAIHGSAGAIAKLPPSKFHDQEANARLIAAAPDLLEALRNAQSAIRGLQEQGAPTTSWADIEASNIAAIAKATGSQE